MAGFLPRMLCTLFLIDIVDADAIRDWKDPPDNRDSFIAEVTTPTCHWRALLRRHLGQTDNAFSALFGDGWACALTGEEDIHDQRQYQCEEAAHAGVTLCVTA